MIWFFIKLLFSTILDIITSGRQSTIEKDLEILVFRQQLSILPRKLNSPIRPNRAEKLTLSILTVKLKKLTNKTNNQLKSVIKIFQPETVFFCASSRGKFHHYFSQLFFHIKKKFPSMMLIITAFSLDNSAGAQQGSLPTCRTPDSCAICRNRGPEY